MRISPATPARKAQITATVDGGQAEPWQHQRREIQRLASAAAAGDFSQTRDTARFNHDFRLRSPTSTPMMQSAREPGKLSHLAVRHCRRRPDRTHGRAISRAFSPRCATTPMPPSPQLTQIVARSRPPQAASTCPQRNRHRQQRSVTPHRQQAANLEETAGLDGGLTSTVRQNADMPARPISWPSLRTRLRPRCGSVVGEVVTTRPRSRTRPRRSPRSFRVIDGIALPDHILALNAAVWSCRAGEQGRGFAVVASRSAHPGPAFGRCGKEIKGLI